MFEIRMLNGKIEVVKACFLGSFIKLHKQNVFSYIKL